MPQSLLRVCAPALLLRDAGVVAIATIRGRGRSISSPRTPVAPAAGARSAAATAMAARGAELCIVVLHRVGVQATRLRARAARVRVRVGVAGLPVPLVVLGLIKIVVVEHLVLVPVQVVVHRRRGQMWLTRAHESGLVGAVVVG